MTFSHRTVLLELGEHWEYRTCKIYIVNINITLENWKRTTKFWVLLSVGYYELDSTLDSSESFNQTNSKVFLTLPLFERFRTFEHSTMLSN